MIQNDDTKFQNLLSNSHLASLFKIDSILNSIIFQFSFSNWISLEKINSRCWWGELCECDTAPHWTHSTPRWTNKCQIHDHFQFIKIPSRLSRLSNLTSLSLSLVLLVMTIVIIMKINLTAFVWIASEPSSIFQNWNESSLSTLYKSRRPEWRKLQNTFCFHANQFELHLLSLLLSFPSLLSSDCQLFEQTQKIILLLACLEHTQYTKIIRAQFSWSENLFINQTVSKWFRKVGLI